MFAFLLYSFIFLLEKDFGIFLKEEIFNVTKTNKDKGDILVSEISETLWGFSKKKKRDSSTTLRYNLIKIYKVSKSTKSITKI